MKKFIISIDAGTTSNRSILFDLKGKPVFSSQKEFTQYFPKNGWVEHDPEEIWRTTIKTLRDVIEKAKAISPSHRGELEITSVNQAYLTEKRLKVELMGPGYAWLDTGTHESLLEAAQFIEIIERRQGLKVACIEEIAFEQGYITKKKLLELAQSLINNKYGQYLLKCAKEGHQL